jgi:tRNA-Thr(GGU) m(6)t(6)A37 methyltransferase TsaA
MPESVTFHPIGEIHSPYKEPRGMPIQGVFAQVEGVVEIYEPYVEGLGDVDGFSHIYIFYAFHRVGQTKLRVKPFLDDAEHGVFATRAPTRPNPLGMSVVKLLAVEGNRIRVGELDVLDGTPLLDIKPYIPKFDYRDHVRAGWYDRVSTEVDRTRADDRFAK